MKNNQQMHHHQSISKLYIDHATLSFFFHIFIHTIHFFSFFYIPFVLICPWFSGFVVVLYPVIVANLFFSFFLYLFICWRSSSYLDIVLLFHVQLCHSLDCVLFSSQRQPTRSPFLFYPLYTLVRESSAFMILSFLCYTHKKGTFLFFIFFLSL